MKSLITITFFLPLLLFSQEKGLFKIELESDFRTFNLESFNETLNNKEYIGSDIYDNAAINDGYGFGLNFSYNINRCISFGIYGETQVGSVKQNIYNEIQDEYGNSIETITTRSFKVQSVNFGLNSNLHLNKFAFWESVPRLSKIETILNLKTGYGKAFFISSSNLKSDEINIHTGGMEYFNNIFTAEGFQIIASLQIGYILSDNKYFSSIGVKLGYQSLKTSSLKRGTEKVGYPANNQKTKLDLSGLVLGVYLNIGR